MNSCINRKPLTLKGISKNALIAMDGMYACFAGAKTGHEKITIFRRALKPKGTNYV